MPRAPSRAPGVRCNNGDGNGQGHRDRSRHDEFLRRRDGRLRHAGYRERRGRADHAVDGGVHRGQGTPRRPAGEAPGGDQPDQHSVRDQAPDRAPVQRSGHQEGSGPGALPDRRGREPGRLDRRPGRELLAEPDFRLHPAEDEGDRGGPSRRGGLGGGDHGARLFQRLPAPGDQGRRQDRRARGAPHHQRADCGGARLRAGEEGVGDDRGLRSGRRHLRHFDPRDRRRGVRGQVDQRRHLPRRRGFRQPDHRIPGRRVQKGPGDRPARRPPGPATPQGGGREGQDRALQQPADRGQPALHHGRPVGAEAPQHQDHPRQAGSPGRRSGGAHGGAVPGGPQGRRPVGGRGRRGDPGRRHDADAEDHRDGQVAVRQGTQSRRQPGRGGRRRRGDPGRRAQGRRQGRAAARRDPRCRSASRRWAACSPG